MALKQPRIQIKTADRGIVSPEVTGLGETIQATNVVVAFAGDRTDHVIVRSAEPPFVLTSEMESIQKAFPGSFVSLMLNDTPGETSLACGDATESVIFAAAAGRGYSQESVGMG
jgi:hypothetical protein